MLVSKPRSGSVSLACKHFFGSALWIEEGESISVVRSRRLPFCNLRRLLGPFVDRGKPLGEVAGRSLQVDGDLISSARTK
jgi:hypothetical protein